MICATASIFAACNTQSDLETKKDVVVTDTSAMYKSNGSTDTATTVVAPPPAAPAPVTTTKIIHDTRTVYVDRTPKAPRQTVRQTSPSQTTSPQPTTGNTQNTNTGTTGTSGTGSTTPAAIPAPVAKDRGWSSAAKDATIGGVGGAIGGAIISKKKGKGAIIGGVLGAAGGYILGRKKDKADTTR